MDKSIPNIDSTLDRFLNLIALATVAHGERKLTAEMVRYAPFPIFEELNCWWNARAIHESFNLPVVCGWAIWKKGDDLVAQHHAVIETNNGLRDITKSACLSNIGSKHVVFARDNRFDAHVAEIQIPSSAYWKPGEVALTWLDRKRFFSPHFLINPPSQDDINYAKATYLRIHETVQENILEEPI